MQTEKYGVNNRKVKPEGYTSRFICKVLLAINMGGLMLGAFIDVKCSKMTRLFDVSSLFLIPSTISHSIL